MLGDTPRLTAAVIASLLSEGLRVRHVVPGSATRSIGSDRYEANLSSPESIRELHALLSGTEKNPVGAVINFLGISEPFSQPGVGDPGAPLRVAHWTFNVLKELQDDLDVSAKSGGGWLLNLTALGGKFGVDGNVNSAISAAGTLGITKTFMRESPKTSVKILDVDLSQDLNLLGARIVQELATESDFLEVGLAADGRRYRLKLKRHEAKPDGNLTLDKSSTVIVTGGAYGVTADVAKGLADLYAPRMILIGRSPLPRDESAATASLDAAGLRKHFITEAKNEGKKLLPAEIERTVQRLLRNRQILGNIKALKDAGSEVEYHALDVRNREAFGGLIDDLYTRFGKIDGVIHGAGIIEDKRIRDKSPESFENVFSTKVDSALTLVHALKPESLKFMVFFSSVSGRFGNAGQADYSAANEFLNKLANWLNSRWPGRISAINWGPWDGGMVSDELRRMYAQIGFDLIPIQEGVDYFLDEIRRDHPESAEVVVSGSVAQMAGPQMG